MVSHDRHFVADGGGLWLGDERHQALAADLARAHGPDLPAPARYSNRTAAAFAAAFPHGILVQAEQADRFTPEGSVLNTDAAILAGWPHPDEDGAP